jgi:hypothetical protein
MRAKWFSWLAVPCLAAACANGGNGAFDEGLPSGDGPGVDSGRGADSGDDAHAALDSGGDLAREASPSDSASSNDAAASQMNDSGDGDGASDGGQPLDGGGGLDGASLDASDASDSGPQDSGPQDSGVLSYCPNDPVHDAEAVLELAKKNHTLCILPTDCLAGQCCFQALLVCVQQ